jgi:putative ABC transport system permease protein
MHGLAENVSSAFRSLASSWLRTTLTTLGILIGVASVALLVSIGLGVEKQVTEQVQGLGANLVFVVPGKLAKNSQPDTLALIGVSTLTSNDLDAILSLPSVHKAAPFLFVGGTVEHNGAATGAFIVGTTASWFAIRSRPLAEGRLFTQDEEKERVCVLAQAPRDAIFGDGPAVGETLMVQGVPLRVVGVLSEEQGSELFGGTGFDNMIFIPAGTTQNEIPRAQINRIIIQTNPYAAPEDVVDQISATLRRTHDDRDDFGVITQKQVLGTIFRLMAIVTSLLSGISAISLAVAGIGIMNIMLVTVSERTHEIGIRKAVGARRRDVFVHFLVESLVISLLGGAAGLAIAGGLSILVRWYSPLRPLFTPAVVAMAFGVCVLLGVIFGTVPALRASRLDPIAALRHE